MKLEQRSGLLEFNENEITVTLDLRQSKKFRNEPFDTESIDAELFVRKIEQNAPILFNHKREQIVSDDYDVTSENGIVIVKVRLDERNMYANTILSLREKSQNRLGCSFSFRCLQDEVRNRHRIVKDLVVSEISILSCESAYPSSVRCLDNDEVRELTMEELQDMIDKSIANALKPKEEIKEEPKEQAKEEVVKEEQKPVEVKLNTEDLKAVFNDFLHDFKATFEQPKVEDVKKTEVKVEEPKVKEKPTIDDEKLKAYQKMLDELN